MAQKILTYEPDKANDWRPHSDGSLPFQAFVVSDQIRRPLLLAGAEVILHAKAIVPKSGDDRNGHYNDFFQIGGATGTYFQPKRGPRAPRAVVEVENTYWTAPMMEFGSGFTSKGTSSGQSREQGGWNKPKRPLGRAGARVGDFNER